MYILRQRIYACIDKSMHLKSAMTQIYNQFSAQEFIEQITQENVLYSAKSMKTIIERLILASALRINSEGVDKLYELIIMNFKYQLLNISDGYMLIAVSFNHWDNIVSMVEQSANTKVWKTLLELYSYLGLYKLNQHRRKLLYHLENNHCKVSIFLQKKLQSEDGNLNLILKDQICPKLETNPGTIVYANGHVENFPVEDRIKRLIKLQVDFSKIGLLKTDHRGTILGYDFYSSPKFKEFDVYLTQSKNEINKNINIEPVEQKTIKESSKPHSDPEIQTETENVDFKMCFFENQKDPFLS
jgi:hypothetical protein